MKKKISFLNMSHSEPLEQHVNQKVEKIEELLKREKNPNPMGREVWLKSNKKHPHHVAELQLKTKDLDLNSQFEGPDMYTAIDKAIDKMVALIKKQKTKKQDKIKKVETEKTQFSSDKYKL